MPLPGDNILGYKLDFSKKSFVVVAHFDDLAGTVLSKGFSPIDILVISI